MPILVIVESPTKAKKIQAFLGSNYLVKTSMGHIRELAKSGENNLGIEVENNFKPIYIISASKKKVVSELLDAKKKCSEVILATDKDREGEGISFHLTEVLGLKNPKRMVFVEITKKALQDALKNMRSIDNDLVNAHKARAILDKLVGYELSPLLWNNIPSDVKGLSAGRVQSVVTRLIIDREKEIDKFSSEPYYRTTGTFVDNNKNKLDGDLDKNFKKIEEVKDFLEKCKTATFTIGDIQKKKTKRYASAPFITSTLQQEAGKKLGQSAKSIMNNAQTLYENGYITYHRTDCSNLSDEIMADIKKYVFEKHGEKYFSARKYKSKVKNAQEAHEAIRPTDIFRENLDDTELSTPQKKLYQIIWKRTVASQMAPCEVEICTVRIDITNPNREEHFIAKAERIVFPGFRVIYDYSDEDPDDDNKDKDNKTKNFGMLEKLKVGTELKYQIITSTEKFTRPTPRYDEPSLVKKMRELGIGTQSTTASIVQNVQDKKYVTKETRKGKKVPIKIFILKSGNGEIEEKKGEITTDAEKNKLYSTDLGKRVTQFLIDNFKNIMEYNFTSKVEEELNDVSNGNKVWQNVVKNVYEEFHPKVKEIMEKGKNTIGGNDSGKRLVGKEETTGLPIYAYIGKYGNPILQIGKKDQRVKEAGFGKIKKDNIRYAKIPPEYSIDSITEEEANKLLIYPKKIGAYNKHDIYLKDGKNSIYIEYNKKGYNIGDRDPEKMTEKEAIEVIKSLEPKKVGEYNGKNIYLKKGRYGSYLEYNGKNYSLPAEMKESEESDKIGEADAIEVIKKKDEKIIKEINKTTKIMNGAYGPFILMDKKIIKIPKDVDASSLTLQDCKDLAKKDKENKTKKYSSAKGKKTAKTMKVKKE